METFGEYLNHDHQRCEQFYVEAEHCVSNNLWDKGEVFFHQFCYALERHFSMEEKVLFAEFEKVVHGSGSPTNAMRDEHQKVRCVVAMLEDALARRARNAFLGHSDTLRIMMGQHHEVEEEVILPIIERTLFEQRREIIEAMNEYCGEFQDARN